MRSCKQVIAGVPCAKCPFRKDVPIYLRRARRQDIADSMNAGQDFLCHATVDYDGEDDEGEAQADTTDAQICAGAAKAAMASGGTTQMMRIAERLGMADLDRTAQRGADVWSLDEWVRLAEGATGENPEWEIDEDIETCNTVDDGCLAPAGFMGMGGAVIRGTEAADLRCSECEEAVCSNCAVDGLCGVCRDWAEEPDDEPAEARSMEPAG